MGSLKGILEKYHPEKWFQRDNLLILVLAGILLVVISLPTKELGEETQETETLSRENQVTTAEESTEDTGTVDYNNWYEYTDYLETRLEDTLKQMKGVGEVSVMITLEASAKQIVEMEETFSRNNTTETDSQGGNRSIYQTDTGQQAIYNKTDNGQSPYVSQTILPEISGVLIVAKGAEVATVKKSIVEIAQALFDIEAHKISVVSMSENVGG